MPREISLWAMNLPKILDEQIERIKSIDNIDEKQMNIGMSVWLTGQFDVFGISKHFISVNEEAMRLGIWGFYRQIPIQINRTSDNEFGQPEIFIMGTKHGVTIHNDEQYNTEFYEIQIGE